MHASSHASASSALALRPGACGSASISSLVRGRSPSPWPSPEPCPSEAADLVSASSALASGRLRWSCARRRHRPCHWRSSPPPWGQHPYVRPNPCRSCRRRRCPWGGRCPCRGCCRAPWRGYHRRGGWRSRPSCRVCHLRCNRQRAAPTRKEPYCCVCRKLKGRREY